MSSIKRARDEEVPECGCPKGYCFAYNSDCVYEWPCNPVCRDGCGICAECIHIGACSNCGQDANDGKTLRCTCEIGKQVMEAADEEESSAKKPKTEEPTKNGRKTITLIQRIEYQVQVEVDEKDLDEGMEADQIIEKYLNGMPDWYGGGETCFIDDN